MLVKFCKEAEKISDYEVEEFFQAHKNDETLLISNLILLYRLRVAVVKKEIEPFQFEVVDFNGDVYSDDITPVGKFDGMGLYSDVWKAKVISQDENALNTLIGI